MLSRPGVGEVADAGHDARVGLGEVEAGGGGEVRRGEHHRRARWSRSVCRKPPMSPSALSSGAPDGRADRSLTAVSSRPCDHRLDGELAAGVPVGEVLGAVDRGAGAVHHAVGVERVDLQRLGHPAELRRLSRAATGCAPKVSHGDGRRRPSCSGSRGWGSRCSPRPASRWRRCRWSGRAGCPATRSCTPSTITVPGCCRSIGQAAEAVVGVGALDGTGLMSSTMPVASRTATPGPCRRRTGRPCRWSARYR